MIRPGGSRCSPPRGRLSVPTGEQLRRLICSCDQRSDVNAQPDHCRTACALPQVVARRLSQLMPPLAGITVGSGELQRTKALSMLSTEWRPYPTSRCHACPTPPAIIWTAEKSPMRTAVATSVASIANKAFRFSRTDGSASTDPSAGHNPIEPSRRRGRHPWARCTKPQFCCRRRNQHCGTSSLARSRGHDLVNSGLQVCRRAAREHRAIALR